jgi:hypothetical protein
MAGFRVQFESESPNWLTQLSSGRWVVISNGTMATVFVNVKDAGRAALAFTKEHGLKVGCKIVPAHRMNGLI